MVITNILTAVKPITFQIAGCGLRRGLDAAFRGFGPAQRSFHLPPISFALPCPHCNNATSSAHAAARIIITYMIQ